MRQHTHSPHLLCLAGTLSVSVTEQPTEIDRYLEKIKTEVRDVDRIQITKVYVCCPGCPLGGGGGGS